MESLKGAKLFRFILFEFILSTPLWVIYGHASFEGRPCCPSTGLKRELHALRLRPHSPSQESSQPLAGTWKEPADSGVR